MRLGPVQLLVVGFDRPDFSGEVLADFERLRDDDIVRVIDLLVLRKDADGVVERVHHSDVTTGEAEGAGAVVGALIGLAAGNDAGVVAGASHVPADGGPLHSDEELWSVDDAIPNDSAAVIALIEHRWAIGVSEAIRAAGGVPIADAWIDPRDLIRAGLTDADDATFSDG